MRVLLVDDLAGTAQVVAQALQQDFGHAVDCVSRVEEVPAHLRRHAPYDVALVDVLFAPRRGCDGDEAAHGPERSVEAVRRALGRPERSGLSVVAALRTLTPATPVVLWTSGEVNRRMHLRYAVEEYQAVSLVHKSRELGGVQDALRRVVDGHVVTDPDLAVYLGPPGAPTVRSTFLRERDVAFWRMLAAGARGYAELAPLMHLTQQHLRNVVSNYYRPVLARFDPGYGRYRSPLDAAQDFATTHRLFFLDEVVAAQAPPFAR